jgi:ABC-type multidrug transport system ATPase subunit
MSDVAISLEHLTKVFGEGEARTVAVDDVSLEIQPGQMHQLGSRTLRGVAMSRYR